MSRISPYGVGAGIAGFALLATLLVIPPVEFASIASGTKVPMNPPIGLMFVGAGGMLVIGCVREYMHAQQNAGHPQGRPLRLLLGVAAVMALLSVVAGVAAVAAIRVGWLK